MFIFDSVGQIPSANGSIILQPCIVDFSLMGDAAFLSHFKFFIKKNSLFGVLTFQNTSYCREHMVWFTCKLSGRIKLKVGFLTGIYDVQLSLNALPQATCYHLFKQMIRFNAVGGMKGG